MEQARWVRDLLDDLGNENTRILVTSDLDEYAIAALQSAPVDAYGVGTSLVTGSGHPTASMVYKLVARHNDAGEFVSVAKAAKNKASVGGRKFALRRLNERGRATEELVGVGELPEADANDRVLLAAVRRSTARSRTAGWAPRACAGQPSATRTPSWRCPAARGACSAASRSSRPFTSTDPGPVPAGSVVHTPKGKQP